MSSVSVFIHLFPISLQMYSYVIESNSQLYQFELTNNSANVPIDIKVIRKVLIRDVDGG